MASGKAQDIAEKSTRSARLRAMKTLWLNKRSAFYMAEPGEEYSAARNLASNFLHSELKKVGYWVPSELMNFPTLGERKAAKIKVIYSDLETIIAFSDNRRFQNYQLFLLVAPQIVTQSKPAQKKLFKILLTALKVSELNDTPNVGMSLRARIAFQEEAFGSGVRIDLQNPELKKLASYGLGEFFSGTQYNQGNMPVLGGIYLEYLDNNAELDTFPILSSLRALGLFKTTYEEDPIVLSFSCYEEYCLLMDSLDDAGKAFKNYCDSAKQEANAKRDEWKKNNPDRVIVNRVETKPVKKPQNITARLQKKLDEGTAFIKRDGQVHELGITAQQRRLLDEGKAKMVDLKFVLATPVEAPESFTDESLLGTLTFEQQLNKMTQNALQRFENRVKDIVF